jgi:hypothetical protein
MCAKYFTQHQSTVLYLTLRFAGDKLHNRYREAIGAAMEFRTNQLGPKKDIEARHDVLIYFVAVGSRFLASLSYIQDGS